MMNQNSRTFRHVALAVALLLLCAALTTALGACQKKEETISLLNDNGEFRYTIIRGDTAGKIEQAAAVTLRKSLTDVLGLGVMDINIDVDWVARNTPEEEIAAKWEILVGETNRTATEEARALLGEQQYVIMVTEDQHKIVILGCDEYHTEFAVNKFLELYAGYTVGNNAFEPRENVEIPKQLREIYTEEYIPVAVGDGVQIVHTTYTTEDVPVVDIVITREKYNVDPTGAEDSTQGIQKALNDCKTMGGGTVFLPNGTYRVTKSITVPAFVCLRGDWQDPDEGTEYGTLILADVKSQDSIKTGLFLLGGSAGTYGLTVYYPDQSADNVKPYPFAFYATGSAVQSDFMASTVKNCTVVNGYYGVGATADSEYGHEQLTVENVKGTFLKGGVYIGRSSDVGTCTNVTVSPKYWAEFAKAKGYDVPDTEKVKAYMRANADGFTISDVEWTQFTHLTISDCKNGIHIIPATRIQFAGCFYDTVVTDCDVAVQVDSLDSRWGMEISDSYLSGSKYGLVNDGKGIIKTAGTTILGGMKGTILVEDDSLAAYHIDTGVTYKKPTEKLYLAELDKSGSTDVSEELQTLLDEAGKTGGVVYLPAGTYRLEKAVTVPAGVELRGCSSLPTRDQIELSQGTMIAAYYGVGGSAEDPAMITLGENAGFNGIRIYYPTNGSTICDTAYAIRGTGSGVYVVNSAIVSAGRGVDFSGCDNHLIKKLTSFCFINDITVGGKNGTVCGFLHNATVRMRKGFASAWADTSDYQDANYVARDYCTSIIVKNATGERVWSVFSYGVATMVKAVNSEDTLVVNVGSDNIGSKTAQHVISGGSYTAINIMRFNGHSYDLENNGKLTMYSRLAINEKREDTIKSK